MVRRAQRVADGGCGEYAAVWGEVAIFQAPEGVYGEVPWRADSKGMEEGAHSGGAGSHRAVPLDKIKGKREVVGRLEHPWGWSRDLAQLRMKVEALLGGPAPSFGEEGNAVCQQGLDPSV